MITTPKPSGKPVTGHLSVSPAPRVDVAKARARSHLPPITRPLARVCPRSQRAPSPTQGFAVGALSRRWDLGPLRFAVSIARRSWFSGVRATLPAPQRPHRSVLGWGRAYGRAGPRSD
jgi:hypothetical protein